MPFVLFECTIYNRHICVCFFRKEINKMNSNEEVFQMSDFFRILGNTTRLKILIMLVKKEYSVNELAQSLNISQ